MSVEQYRRQVAQKEKIIADLQRQKSRAFEKVVTARKKANDAANAAKRTANSSTASTKLREAQRYGDEEARAMKEFSNIEQKISAESTRLNQENQRLQLALATEHRKQEQQQKKRFAEQKQLQDAQDRTVRNMNADLDRQERLLAVTASELKRLTELPPKIVVAFFASDPGRDSATRLALDEEARSIGEKIRLSQHRDAVQLQTWWAVRPLDILQAINELSPTIVHFSGHGSDQDELVLQDDRGQPKFISKQAIIQTISVASESVRLVVFNTCFSFNQAQEAVKHVDAAIGMNSSIGDEAARVFSSQLYSGIGFGRSIVAAFNQAKAALMMEAPDEAETPRLYIKEGVLDSDLVLVNPEDRG